MEQKFGDKLGSLDLTDDEIKRLGECMKDDKFMDLLRDYTMAISDPENKKKYEEEIAMLEIERGNDVKFIHPCPGHVLKTSRNGEDKCFINICSSPKVGKPVSKATVQGATRGMQWSIPHSLSQPREDKDKAGGNCFVYDVVFHPDTYHMSEKNTRFRKMIHDMALDAVERLFSVTLDKINVKKPKMKFKGLPQASIIRTPREDTRELDAKIDDPDDPLKVPYPPTPNGHAQKDTGASTKAKENTSETPKTQSNNKLDHKLFREGQSDILPIVSSVVEIQKEEYVEPKYTIAHRGYFEMSDYYNVNENKVHSTRPREIIMNIELPMLKAASALHLEIFEDRIFLECAKPVKYKLSLNLPYGVDDSKGHARFDKSKRRLTITLEVLPPKRLQLPAIVSQDENACGSCFQKEGESKSEPKKEQNEDPSENDLLPSDHPSGLVHGRTQCRHQNHGELWDVKYENDWNKETDLGMLSNPSPFLVEKLLNYEMGKKKPKYVKVRPQIFYHQDEAYVTIIVNIKLIDSKKLWYVLQHNCLQFSCMTDTDEFSPDSTRNIYQFMLSFNENDFVDPRRSRVDISSENAVFLLRKHLISWHEWQTVKMGFDSTMLKTISFATEQNINDLITSVESQVQNNRTREFECENISDGQNSELLALKLLPKEITDEERLPGAEDVVEEQNVGHLPGLEPDLVEARKDRDEKKKRSIRIDHERVMSKTLNLAGSHFEVETDEDDDSDTYETADSSSEEEKILRFRRTRNDSTSHENATRKKDSQSKEKVEEEKDECFEEVLAKINANAFQKLNKMQEDARKRNETIIFREFKRGGGEEKKTFTNHSTRTRIRLNNEMLFETD
uniref:protein kintoun-like n=1 Tax=Styela clava TaxID=7725 RepID=UPI00193A70AC|nr:protein kintoun-like [Styela clava]